MNTKTMKNLRQTMHTAVDSSGNARMGMAPGCAPAATALLLCLALAACVSNPQTPQDPAADLATSAATDTAKQEPDAGAAPNPSSNPASDASASGSGGGSGKDSAAATPLAPASAASAAAAQAAPVAKQRVDHPVPVARCGPVPRDVNLARYLGELRAKDEASYDLFELMLLPDGERRLAQRLAQGANPNVCGGPFQLSLLATAAIGAHAQTMLQLLLDHDANLNAPLGEAGESALVYAIRANHLGAAQFLLAQGAKADLPFGAGETALSELAKSAKDKDHNTEQELALAAQLLAHQLSPNSADTQPGRGMTPLMWAVLTNKPELIALFKAQGGDPSVKNAKGQDAIALAKALKRDEALKALEAP